MTVKVKVDADPFIIPKGMSLAEHFTRFHVITDQHREACRAMMPEDAIQKVSGQDSGKKYDAHGYGYQWIADRLGEVFGPGGWTETHETIETKGTWGKYKTENFHITCKMTLMVGHWFQPGNPDAIPIGVVLVPVFLPVGSWTQYGEHTAGNRADSRKGAHGNALKKVTALGLGIGASAFRGTIDEDMAGARPAEPHDRVQAQPPASPRQAQERDQVQGQDAERVRGLKATRPGKCCLGSHEIMVGEWIMYPVANPFTGRAGAACSACYEKEFFPKNDTQNGINSPSGAAEGSGHPSGPPDGSDGHRAADRPPVDDPDDDLPF